MARLQFGTDDFGKEILELVPGANNTPTMHPQEDAGDSSKPYKGDNTIVMMEWEKPYMRALVDALGITGIYCNNVWWSAGVGQRGLFHDISSHFHNNSASCTLLSSGRQGVFFLLFCFFFAILPPILLDTMIHETKTTTYMRTQNSVVVKS